MNKLLGFLCILFIAGCTPSSTETHQGKRDNIVNVNDQVKEIEINDILCNRLSEVYIVDDYLIIIDYKSYDKQIHLLNKKDFRYLISTAPIGQGPGEITNIGGLMADNTHHEFYVMDHGKQKIFNYVLDSVLSNPEYMPAVQIDMKGEEFPSDGQFLNDSILIGPVIRPTSASSFQQYTASWNIYSGKLDYFDDLHPEIRRKRYAVARSLEQGVFVECYRHHDLMCIRKLNGELKRNIYGVNWNTEDSNKSTYYSGVVFCKDKIVASYVGGDSFYIGNNGRPSGVSPTKLVVFDSDGSYIKTLETGRKLMSFCYDEENNRLILNMDDEIQFGYLDLEGLLD